MQESEALRLAGEFLDKMPAIKTESDLSVLSRALKKLTVERALSAELDYHLETEELPNSRNGYSSKTIHTEDGAIELITPRDRNSTFELAMY
jgi:putative transposase